MRAWSVFTKVKSVVVQSNNQNGLCLSRFGCRMGTYLPVFSLLFRMGLRSPFVFESLGGGGKGIANGVIKHSVIYWREMIEKT